MLSYPVREVLVGGGIGIKIKPRGGGGESVDGKVEEVEFGGGVTKCFFGWHWWPEARLKGVRLSLIHI